MQMLTADSRSRLPRIKVATFDGATHLFEEPGALEEVARLARMWFEEHLGRKMESDYAA